MVDQNKTVLLVEPSDHSRRAFKGWLAQADYPVIDVRGRQQMVENLHDQSFCLALVSAEATDLAGILSVINKYAPDTPIVLVNQSLQQIVVSDYSEYGVVHVLETPIMQNKFLTTVSRHIKK